MKVMIDDKVCISFTRSTLISDYYRIPNSTNM